MSTSTNTSPAPAGNSVRIEPDAWYTDPDLSLILRLTGSIIGNAKQSSDGLPPAPKAVHNAL